MTLSQCHQSLLTFPSPLGVSYFQIIIGQIWHYWHISVSVPSRGILFPNNGEKMQIDDKMIVSVPSRGILFPNSYVLWYSRWLPRVSVPSRGILFPNNHYGGGRKACGKLSFRPLSGYLISKWWILMDSWEQYGIRVSVPSRGILFPNNEKKVIWWN